MNKLTSLIGIAAIGATLTTSELLAQERIDDRWRFRPYLVGSWQATVTVRENGDDCAATEPVTFGVNPFPSLQTFHAGGTVSETGSRSPPSRRSPGHGVWKRTGVNEFASRYSFQGFDEFGALSTNMDIRTDLKLSPDGNSFTGVARLRFTILAAENTMPFCATLVGTRYTI